MARKVELELDITSDVSGLDTDTATRDLRDLQDAADATKDAIGDISSTEVDISVEDRALETLQDRIRDLRRQMSDDIALGVDSSEARKDLTRAESDYRTLKRSIERDTIEIDVEVDQSGGGGFSAAREASGEFKQEALANFSEVTSSFDGSMASIGDLAQGTLGGLASGFSETLGGIKGLMAGLGVGVAAAGVGLAISRLEQLEEAAQETRDASVDMAEALLESGQSMADFAREGGYARDAILELARAGSARFHWFWEDGATGLDDLQESLAITGLTVEDFVTAAEQGPDALRKLAGGMTEVADATVDYSTPLKFITSVLAAAPFQKGIDEVDKLADSMDNGADIADILGTATGDAAGDIDGMADAAGDAEDAVRDAHEAYAEWVGTLGNSRAAYDDVLDAYDGLHEAITDNGSDFTSNSVEARANRDALEEVTTAQQDMLTGMIESGEGADTVRGQYETMRAELIDQLEQLGLNTSAAETLADEYLGTTGDWEATLIANDEASKVTAFATASAEAFERTYTANLDAQLTATARANIAAANEAMRAGGGTWYIPEVPRSGAVPRVAPAANTTQPINMVRVSIAGREVQAQVDAGYATSREAEQFAQLVGSGTRA